MDGTQNGNPAHHFGRQLRKERLAHGWSLPELSKCTGINAGHLSKIETGKRPPTEYVATECDRVFPERRGWFLEYVTELRTWAEVPASFRDWSEIEVKSASLRDWSPSIVTGLLQTEDYARALITVQQVAAEVATTRLAARIERQRRVLFRDDPPKSWFLVDLLSLYRDIGSPAVMADQLRHLTEVASLPNITLQVLPAIAHPANASGFLLADDAAWCEHVAGGFTYTTGETVSALAARFDTLRGESYRVSESTALIGRLGEVWTTGVSPLTAMATAATA